MAIATINPATGETVKTFDALSNGEIDDRLGRARTAFTHYRRTSFEDRSAWMRRAADILDRDRADVSRMMTTEMGKTFAAAQAEAAKCATA